MVQAKTARKEASEDSLVVRYRVTRHEFKRLSVQAKKYNLSPHLYARQLAFDVIDNAERSRILFELEELQRQLAEVRNRLQIVNDFVLELDSDVQTIKGKKAVGDGKR